MSVVHLRAELRRESEVVEYVQIAPNLPSAFSVPVDISEQPETFSRDEKQKTAQ
jgi:hypothetical protein